MPAAYAVGVAVPNKFPQANAVWRGWPAGNGKEAVADLHAYRDKQRSISCWELTAAEVAEVMRTGRVWLHVFGQHPPVYVGGESPFQEQEQN